MDCNKITIGSNVLIAPNVQLYTATHPIDLDERLAPVETEDGIKRVRRTYALPITHYILLLLYLDRWRRSNPFRNYNWVR